jgi:hypothetical protein
MGLLLSFHQRYCRDDNNDDDDYDCGDDGVVSC